MSGFAAVGYFLFSTFFSLLLFTLWLRFALRYFRVSSLHPVSQTINQITNPVIKPFQVLFKSANTRTNRYDWACLCALVVCELIKFSLLALLFMGAFPSLLFLLIYTLSDLIIQPCDLLFYAIIIRVVISWINPVRQNPVAEVLYLVTEPLLLPARRWIPPVSGIDFSPFVVLILLKVITLFVSASLPASFI